MRWLVQGSGNVYTAPSRRYYLPDDLLGWRVVHDGPVWLGLEVLAVLGAVGVAVAVGAWWIRRRERREQTVWRPLRPALWLLAALPLAVPVWAWTSGLSPDEARDRLPVAEGVELEAAPAGVSGRLADAPAGRYQVVAGEGSAITAGLKAGGDSFDARFTGNIDGFLSIDTRSLAEATKSGLSVSVRVDAASVDTGITTRSKHAREYLKVEEFEDLRFTLGQLLAARQGADASSVEFWARGAIEMMGQKIEVTVRGQLRVLDAEARERFALQAPGLLAKTDFTLSLTDTPLAGDAGDFDVTDIPIHASLVLVHRPGVPAQP